MKIKYDSEEAINMVEEIMKKMRDTAYATSVELAREKGCFEIYDQEGWNKSQFVKYWMHDNPNDKDRLEENGIRNSFLLTCAPVGSGSIVAQTSSGIEPIFATSYTRKVKSKDASSFAEYKTHPKIIKDLFGDDKNLPDYVVTAHDITPEYRVEMQATIQRYLDNAVSSTVNLKKDVEPKVISKIYLEAWEKGLKGITVYRDGSREGILTLDSSIENQKKIEDKRLKNKKRPITLSGKTYKIPSGPEEKLYITINPDPDNPKRPYEVFISTFGSDNPQLQTITVLLSALLKNINNGPDFIIEDLRKIESSQSPAWWHDTEAGRRHQINSVPRAVAIALEKFLAEARNEDEKEIEEKQSDNMTKCPKCYRDSYIYQNGCGHCVECGYEKCS